MKNVTATAEMKYCTFPDSLESVLVQDAPTNYYVRDTEREREREDDRTVIVNLSYDRPLCAA